MQQNIMKVDNNYQNTNNDNERVKSQQSDQVDHYADDTPLPKAKPMDLKEIWLGETVKSLQKFNTSFNELKKQQKGLYQGFKIFAQNQHKYKLSSLRKIQIKLDKKKLYQQYMMKTRKTIQKINPALIMNILSYTDDNLFLALYKIRRVSKIFNDIALNQQIQFYLAQKDYLYSQGIQKVMKSSLIFCKKYAKFHKTFLYYKQMHYTEQIPQNSIMKDFQQAVSFINQIHKLVQQKHTKDFTYYDLMNSFMRKHRVVIGLSSLSLTSLVMVRKAAIIAFSNYLAFNISERSKEQITKTKYSKVISVVEYEDYRDSLIINTRVSNYLYQKYNLNFAVLVTNNIGKHPQNVKVITWNILLYHLHNEQKAIYLQNLNMIGNKYISAQLDAEFSQNMEVCKFSIIQYTNWVQLSSIGKCMDTISSPIQNYEGIMTQKISLQNHEKQQFSFCYFYRFQQYYVFAIPNQIQ